MGAVRMRGVSNDRAYYDIIVRYPAKWYSCSHRGKKCNS